MESLFLTEWAEEGFSISTATAYVIIMSSWMKGTIWELKRQKLPSRSSLTSVSSSLERSDLRCMMTISLGQCMSTSGKFYLPNKTDGWEFKPDKLHKCRKITTGDKRRITAIAEFHSTRCWEGSATKLAIALHMPHWKHKGQQKVMSTFS